MMKTTATFAVFHLAAGKTLLTRNPAIVGLTDKQPLKEKNGYSVAASSSDRFYDCDTCRESYFPDSVCDGNCHTCGWGSGWTASSDCISCQDGYEIDVVYDDCTGYCVPNGTATIPVYTSSCTMLCDHCGFPMHPWAETASCPTSLSDSCATSALSDSSVIFQGDSTYGACVNAVGTASSNCITCEEGYEISVVGQDCSGYCMLAGTAITPISESSCEMPCASCSTAYDGLYVNNEDGKDDSFCFHVKSKIDYKGVEYTYEELKAGKEPECTVPHSPSSRGVIISTSCGNSAHVTDTHLMATSKGFKLAYSLKEGDVLFGDYSDENECVVVSVEKEKYVEQYFGLNCLHSEVLVSGLRASTFGDFHTLPSWYMTYVGGILGSDKVAPLGDYIAEWYFQK